MPKWVTGTIAGTNYAGLVAPGDFIKSYSATIGKNVVVVTNSLEQLRSIIQVSAGKKTSLHSRGIPLFPPAPLCAHPLQHEHVFALISDATIRTVRPGGRIGASCRTRAASALAELQARNESGPP